MTRRRVPFPSHIDDDWGGVRRRIHEERQAKIDREWTRCIADWTRCIARIPRPKAPAPNPPAIEVTEPQTEDERAYWLLRAAAPEERN